MGPACCGPILLGLLIQHSLFICPPCWGTLLVSLTPFCSDLDSTCAQLACPLAPQDLAWHLGLYLISWHICRAPARNFPLGHLMCPQNRLRDASLAGMSRRGLRPSESLARLLHLVKVPPLSLCSEYVPGVTLWGCAQIRVSAPLPATSSIWVPLSSLWLLFGH